MEQSLEGKQTSAHYSNLLGAIESAHIPAIFNIQKKDLDFFKITDKKIHNQLKRLEKGGK
jgi:hypothetical protein